MAKTSKPTAALQAGPLPRILVEGRDVPPHLTVDGDIRQPGRVELTEWRDIEDKTALSRDTAGRAGQRMIRGYRAIDPLDRLPCDKQHKKAAERLRSDWERGSGATSGSGGEKVDGGSRDTDHVAAQLQARRAYQDAVEALGLRASHFVLPVVLSGWTCADLVKKHGGNPMTMQGRVMAGLDRLVEHYTPPKTDASSFVPPSLLSALVDPEVTDIPQAQIGRWDRAKAEA